MSTVLDAAVIPAMSTILGAVVIPVTATQDTTVIPVMAAIPGMAVIPAADHDSWQARNDILHFIGAFLEFLVCLYSIY